MIVSFHPCIEADVQIILGDRAPDENIREIIMKSSAIILPQSCPRTLYTLCCSCCSNVFPNYDVRYKFPGKTGQARLFSFYGITFPRTFIWESVEAFQSQYKGMCEMPHGFPFIIKTDQGHEGDGVFFVENEAKLKMALDRLFLLQETGSSGFISQDFVFCGARVLRVVIIGRRLISYWKVGSNGTDKIVTINRGAKINHTLMPHLQRKGKEVTREFCAKTGVDLAALDFVFPVDEPDGPPLVLEINYYFGRRGLGGAERFYEMLFHEIRGWLQERGLDASRIKLV